MPRFLCRYSTLLTVAFFGGAAFFLLSIESTFNGGFGLTVRYGSLPLAILIFGYTYWYRQELARICRSGKMVWIRASLLYPVVLLLSWPYVLGVNAFTGSGETITFTGPVEEKWITKGRHTGYHIAIRDSKTQEEVRLNCSESRYQTLQIGDSVSESFEVGGLNIPYRWKSFSRSQVVDAVD